MYQYEIEIKEIHIRTIYVRANSEAEALEFVPTVWKAEKITLGRTDLDKVCFDTESVRYCLNSDGLMKTGPITVNERHYYFNPEPYALAHRFLTLNSRLFVFDPT